MVVVLKAFEFIPSISCYHIIYRITHPFILDDLPSRFYFLGPLCIMISIFVCFGFYLVSGGCGCVFYL